MTLRKLPVLVLDCQATSSDPRTGHLLEIAWSETSAEAEGAEVESYLVRLPDGAIIPDLVKSLTGISEADAAQGEPLERIRQALAGRVERISRADGVCSIVVHFAPFERRYLERLEPAPRWICTHAISRRLLPLPRLGLRAVAGYFGHGVSELRRAADHVRATASVWRGVVDLLEREEGIDSLADLAEWLSSAPPRKARAYPMPRSVVGRAPRGPGIYRMLRGNGDVLYVGKAASVRDRVSSYFGRRAPHGEHILEMLSQARGLETLSTPTALEAALLELDEIQRLSPPYNKALRARRQPLVFASPDLLHFSPALDREHRVGPLPALRLWPMTASLKRRLSGEREEKLAEVFFTDETTFALALDRFRSSWTASSLLAHGAREWLRAEEEPVEELQLAMQYDLGVLPRQSAEEVVESLNDLALRASHLVRRSHWLPLLGESTLVWRARGGERIALVIEAGSIHSRWKLEEGEPPPDPPGALLPFPERRRRIDAAAYDRLTVLTREIRRLLREGREVSIHLGRGRRIDSRALARMLRWI